MRFLVPTPPVSTSALTPCLLLIITLFPVVMATQTQAQQSHYSSSSSSSGEIFASSPVLDKRSDDVSLGSLQVLVQQQASVIQALQVDQEALKNRVGSLESDNGVLKAKVATLSKDVAFTVRFKADDGTNGVAIGTHSALRFDDVALNIGNGYNPVTGFFTAPTAGTYAFFLTQMGAGAHGSTLLAIVKEGQALDYVYSKDHEDQGSSQVTVRLGAGDRVWIQHYTGDAVRGAWYTLFSGYLLHAE